MTIEADNPAWAKPYVEEARAAVARGAVLSLDDAIADIELFLDSLKP